MKIKKGDKFLCIKDVKMAITPEFDNPHTIGKIYTSDEDGYITNNYGGWTSLLYFFRFNEYFKPLKDVDRMYTKATDRLRELHRNFAGTKLGNTDNAEYFDNRYMKHKDFSFSAQPRLVGFYKKEGYDYVSEEVFIELNGLEEKSYEEDPYSWVNNGIREAITVKKTFNPKPYYDNSKGSLYKVATERGWNSYIFDVVKRLERGGKKDPLKQEIEKSIDVLKIWLNEID